SSSDFGFGIAFGAGGSDAPGMCRAFERGEMVVGERRRRMLVKPLVDESRRENFAEFRFQGSQRAGKFGIGESGGKFVAGSDVERNAGVGFPIRRNLQDGGAAESAMGEEHFFAEAGSGARIMAACFDFGGESGEGGVVGAVAIVPKQRNERRALRLDSERELAGEVVSEAGGAHLRDGEAASGNDERGSAKFVSFGVMRGANGELARFGDVFDFCIKEDA